VLIQDQGMGTALFLEKSRLALTQAQGLHSFNKIKQLVLTLELVVFDR
jgi:hypothetical protein